MVTGVQTCALPISQGPRLLLESLEDVAPILALVVEPLVDHVHNIVEVI